MANALNRDVTGCVVRVDPKILLPQYRDDPAQQEFLVEGGFGAVPYTSGSALLGRWVVDNEKGRIGGYDITEVVRERDQAV